MKFDFCIGNPPYQEEQEGKNDTYAPPVYNKFLDAAYEVADKVEMIHPARFLFNAGSTPKEWNQKMLGDEYLKVMFYEQESSKIFRNTDIKGGICVTYRNKNKKGEAIQIFTTFEELNSTMKKVNTKEENSFSQIISGRTIYHFHPILHKEHPEVAEKMSAGHENDIMSNAFDKLEEIFTEDKPDDGAEYVQMFGLYKKKRAYRWVKRAYIDGPGSFLKWKVFVPEANGSGAIGEVLSTPLIGAPLIGAPLIGATDTFLSIGSFETKFEAEACLKYVKSKFVRVLLGILKVTQHNPAPKWKYVPLQDFTPNSDIDWSKSVSEIDQQLYKKYGLSQEEIDFIESHVKEMA